MAESISRESIVLDKDNLKNTIKRYYILFSHQQTMEKIRKTKSGESATGTKKKEQVIFNSDKTQLTKGKGEKTETSIKMNKFKVSKQKEVIGNIYFNQNNYNFSLDFNIVNPGLNKTYSESIYLPILIDLNEIINRIRLLKSTNYQEYTYGNITLDIYLELNELEEQIILIKNEINEQKIYLLNQELQAENELLIDIKNSYIKLNTIETSDVEKRKDFIFKEYLTRNQTLNHTLNNVGQQIIAPGTRVRVGDNYGIITNINYDDQQYTINIDGNEKVVNIAKKKDAGDLNIEIVSSIRNYISDKKKETHDNKINIIEFIDKIRNPQLLLDVLNISLSVSEIKNRPRLEITTIDSSKSRITNTKIIDNIKTFFTDIPINELYDSSSTKLIIGKKMNEMQQSNIDIPLENWNILLSMNDISKPFIIDDFEFNSILHYHIASQFYNREDLPYNIKMEYNNFFIKFTNNFTGLGSFSSKPLKSLNHYITNSSFKKHIDWYSKTQKNDSLSSIYLKKAYYTKFIKYPELSNALISTYPSILYEKLGRNKYLINYELMLVRYYLRNNITPSFYNFNYNPNIYATFINTTSDNVRQEHELLLDVFLKLNAYENRTTFFSKNEILYQTYFSLDTSGKTGIDKLEKYFTQLLFSYNVVYIYESIYSYIIDVKSSEKSIDDYIKRYNIAKDKSLWIFRFYYRYITEILIQKERNLESQKQQTIEETGLFEQIHRMDMVKKYNVLKKVLFSNKYLLVDGPIREENGLLDSVIEFLNRNRFKPFDISNTEYSYSKISFYKNTIINDKEVKMYNLAVSYLNTCMKELYLLNKKNEKLYESTDYKVRFDLLSCLLGLDITIITESETYELNMEDILPEYSNNIGRDDFPLFNKPRGHIVLGHISNTDFFFSTKPDISSNDEILNYLIEEKTNYVIDESTGKYKIIGKWNPELLLLDINNTDPGDTLKGEIEVEDFILYNLNGRTYYKDKELYFSKRD